MAFPLELTAVLSGASSHQLRLWRTRKILVPEVNAENPALYSYRDVVALRTIAYMRSQTSMQKIGRAFQTLQSLQFTEHPSTYKFGISAGTIFFRTPEGDTVDLSNQAGSGILFTLEDIFQEFSNHRDATVVNFRRPMPHLQVDRSRLGGWPTIEQTRIGYDVISTLVDGTTVTADDVDYYYPSVTPEAARDAIRFNKMVQDAA